MTDESHHTSEPTDKMSTEDGPIQLTITHMEIPVRDLDRAMKFFADSMDWTCQRFKGMPHWVCWMPSVESSEAITGGFDSSIPQEVGATSLVPMIHTDDIEKALDRVRSAGGTVVEEVEHLPPYGRQAGFRDSEGNHLRFWQGNPEYPHGPHGALHHVDVYVKDLAAAKEWYSKLFGWTFMTMEHHKPDSYAMWTSGDPKAMTEPSKDPKQKNPFHGGMYQTDEPISDKPGCMLYFKATAEFPADAILDRVEAAGGKVLKRPTPISPEGVNWDVGSNARFSDPDGNVWGIYTEGPNAAEDAVKLRID